MVEPASLPQILTTCSGGRSSRTSSVLNSPEFEFCNSFSQHNNFLSADELFSGGVLLPLHHLRLPNDAPPTPFPAAPDPESSRSDPAPPEPEISTSESAQLISASSKTLSYSKRLMDIFRKNDKKCSPASMDIVAEDHSIRAKDLTSKFKENKRDRKTGVGGMTVAELNINIWPFSRSRSSGNGATRPRSAAAALAARQVSSAPCSRSNSTGESKSRKWPSSPGRGGIHLGRSSPVWQPRHGAGGGRRRSVEALARKDGSEGRRKIPLPSPGGGGGRSKGKVLSLSVPVCIGYRENLSCRNENSAGVIAVGVGGGGVSGEGVRGSNLFNIKGLFTKKVY